MKKQFLSLAMLVALVTYAPYTHSAAGPAQQHSLLSLSLKTRMVRAYIKDLFKTAPAESLESEDAFIKAGLVPKHMTIGDIKPELGRGFYLHKRGCVDWKDPDWLVDSFYAWVDNDPTAGFSIQDFPDYGNKLEAKIEEGLLTLDLSAFYINDLTGIQNIPDIKKIQKLNLDKNRITIIPFDALKNLFNLQILSMDKNLIQVIEQNAFSDLTQLKVANFFSAFDESTSKPKEEDICDRLEGLRTVIAPGVDISCPIRFLHRLEPR